MDLTMDGTAQWEADVNEIEKVLKQCLECRVKNCVNERLILRNAFRIFDTDNNGTVDYREFVRALEKFGLAATPQVRGLFDRYAQIDSVESETMSYDEFASGLFGSEKPPIPPKRDTHSWSLNGDTQMRESPANRWATSVDQLAPNERQAACI